MVGEGWKIEDKIAEAKYYDERIVDFFRKLETESDNLDSLFISPLKSLRCNANQYCCLLDHFKRFKEANFYPIIGTLVSDNVLQNLVSNSMTLKICRYFSIKETKYWRRYIEKILDFLEPLFRSPKSSIEDYEGGMAVAFSQSAYRLNSDLETVVISDKM